MKVTPVGKNFNKHAIGEVFVLPDKLALALIKIGKVREVTASESIVEAVTAAVVGQPSDAEISPRTGLPKRQYRRRDMQAQA